MNLTHRWLFFVALLVPAIAQGADTPAGKPGDAFAYNRLLGRGVNLGNALEAPREGEWGMTLKEEFFEQIAKAGFNSVRVPIRWSAHAEAQTPYVIDAKFFERIDWVIDQILSRKMAAVVNVHHYEEMDKQPEQHLPRLKALWKQIAERYRSRPDRLFFEIFNEPHDGLTDERWQEVFPQVLGVIRESNPERAVIVGPGGWNNAHHLEKLSLPEKDRMLIVTVHNYSPYEFTHQGAEWAQGSDKWKGRTWSASPEELAALRKDLQRAADWGKKHTRPIYLGEFGSYHVADMDSRVRWTRAMAREAEQLGMSWSYWEFGAGFGAFDRESNAWRNPLLKALMDKK